MELEYILQLAILSIESLKDYYFSQIDKITKEVDKKITKYIPGTLVERYLFARATNQDEFLNDDTGIKITRIAEKILNDINIYEKNSSYEVSYKLNESFENTTKYEIDPKKAAREFRKLSERAEILNNSTLISLLIKYEETIAGIFRYLISKYPVAYLASKTLSYSEIMEINSETEDIKEILLEREVEEIMRKAIAEWYKLLEEKHKVKFDNLKNIFLDFKEIYYRRNIIVHNNGIVNMSYLNGVDRIENIKKGMRLSIDKDYIRNAFQLTYIMIYGTIFAMSNKNKDSYSLYDTLHDYAFQHMIDSEWEVGYYIYENIMNKKTPTTPTIDIEMWKVNYWICKKNLFGVDEICDEINSYDVSAMEGKFKIAKACLLDDFKKVSSLLDIHLNTQIYPQNIENWPLFIQYRKSKEYKKFKQKHIEDFKKQVYDPEKIKREDMDEDILEKVDALPG